MMSNKSSISPALPQLSPGDLLLMQSGEEMDTMKCDTPNTERKNLFGMARDTMGKMKQNIKLKKQELINMVYNPHERSSDEEDDIDKLVQLLTISSECIK